MCQQKTNKLKLENGYILILVLSILLLISIIIISITRIIITNNNIVNINSDRKYTLELANLALNIAEKEIVEDITLNKIPFPNLNSYDQNQYPVVFTHLLQSGPKLIKFLDSYKNNNNSKYFEQIFTNNCLYNKNNIKTQGLCAPAVIIDNVKYGQGIPSWERPGVFYRSENNPQLNSREITIDKLNNSSSQNPRYIVEFLGITFPERNILLRVTTRAWGKNKNTKVTLQSYLEINQN